MTSWFLSDFKKYIISYNVVQTDKNPSTVVYSVVHLLIQHVHPMSMYVGLRCVFVTATATKMSSKRNCVLGVKLKAQTYAVIVQVPISYNVVLINVIQFIRLCISITAKSCALHDIS